MTRRRNSEIEISMFPFLSVLCAVIGILMLFVIVIIGTRVMEAGTVGRRAVSGTAGGLLQVGVEEEHYRLLETELLRLSDELAGRRAEYQRLLAVHAQLADLLRTMEEEDANPSRRRGTNLRAKDKVHVVPDERSEFPLQPIRIEVGAQGFTVHPEKEFYPLDELRDPGSSLNRYLQKVHGERNRKYIVFLVRPNGVAAFKEILNHVAGTFGGQLRFGFEPVPAGWEITEPKTDQTI